MNQISDAEAGIEVSGRVEFRKLAISLGFADDDFSTDYDFCFLNPTLQLMWRTWLHCNQVRFEDRLEKSVESAIAPYRTGTHEVAVAFEPGVPFLGCPTNWGTEIFARIEWFQFNERSHLQTLGLSGWQLARDQRGTVVERLARVHLPRSVEK